MVKTEKVEQDLKEKGEYVTTKKTDVVVTKDIAGKVSTTTSEYIGLSDKPSKKIIEENLNGEITKTTMVAKALDDK